MKKTTTILALAIAGSLAGALPALATESVSIIGISPAAGCADAAAAAVKTGGIPTGGMLACDAAIKGDDAPRHELAINYLNRSALYLSTGNYQAAVEDDTQALRLDGNLPEALINRAAAFSGMKQNAAAVQDLTQALALNPAHAEHVYYNRGLAREDQGDVKGAYFDYQKAAQLAPGWDRPQTELARFTVRRVAQG